MRITPSGKNILHITVLYRKPSGPFPPIPLKIYQRVFLQKHFTSTQSTSKTDNRY